MIVDTITVPVRINPVIGKEYMDDWQSRIYLQLRGFVNAEGDQRGVKTMLDQSAAYVVMKMIETNFMVDGRPKAEARKA